jgi:hypothetical protein
LPRKRDIEAAIAAHNSTVSVRRGLPPEAGRLLAVLFPRGDVCTRTVGGLAAEGFDRATANRLLHSLVGAGLVSKDHRGQRQWRANTYRLHLPPRRQS